MSITERELVVIVTCIAWVDTIQMNLVICAIIPLFSSSVFLSYSRHAELEASFAGPDGCPQIVPNGMTLVSAVYHKANHSGLSLAFTGNCPTQMS